MAAGTVAAWSAYWRSGALHSLDTSGQVGEFAMLADWIGWLDALPDGARVADLACGNGLLARLALGLEGARHDPGRRVHAVDIAELAPRWVHDLDAARREQLRWHERTPIEDLPAVEGGFDAFCSQFGFEYAEPTAAVAALSRGAAADARLGFIVHHADSIFVRQGAGERAALHWLLEPAGLFDTAARVAENLVARFRGAALGAAAERVRHEYNRLQQDLDRYGSEHPERQPVLGEAREAVHAALVHAAQTGDAQWLSRQREAFDFALLRLENLIRVARSEQQIAGLQAELAASGWGMMPPGLVHQPGTGTLLGWRMQGRFRPPSRSTTPTG